MRQMNSTIQRLLEGKEQNHILPFFWQHGEEEAVLREMMGAIHGANCRAVCVESRPHPDFCGPKWWADMDVILDEARKREMKVWILDDSHFPTGYANGAVLKAEPELCRQNVFCNTMELTEEAKTVHLDLRESGLLDAPKKEGLSPMEAAFFAKPPARTFDPDTDVIFQAAAVKKDGTEIELTGFLKGCVLLWEKPKGAYTLRVVTASRNSGYHRDYINMTDAESCKILLDAVYEPHWQHYKEDFGKTIAGFFSDEPELGNGFLYEQGNRLGSRQDLPWSREIEKRMEEELGKSWKSQLHYLWEQNDSPETARVHYVYMDILTGLVKENFSNQVGEWCRKHGVQYIGHVIEDNGQHCRTGSSLGHYFRSLEGQDMAGIDDIGGQVLPQGEDEPKTDSMHRLRNGEFYHYGLAKLAESAAAIEPLKQGNSMCEIFGNYGWEEGVKLEKYLADHFLVRGINHFVPHAFSGKAFPDPDCPPHFYAHGHHPQYRHFGKLMTYMNRIADLTSSGKHKADAAVLYHGEMEWCDADAMPFEKPLRVLYDAQIDGHVLPSDVFAKPEFYRMQTGNPFRVNGQEYKVLLVPACERIPKAAADGLEKLCEAGLPVFFVKKRPVGICETKECLSDALNNVPVVELGDLVQTVRNAGVKAPELQPENQRVRILEVMGETPLFLLVNEGTQTYKGTLFLPDKKGPCYYYDGWMNRCEVLDAEEQSGGIVCRLEIEPGKSRVIVFGECTKTLWQKKEYHTEIKTNGWIRTTCEGAEYPGFSEEKQVTLPDDLAEEQPEFSGFVRYETTFELEADRDVHLLIEDASEGVEVFLNGESAGIQIVPEYHYDLCGKEGINKLVIEVATTLERQCYPLLEGYRKMLASPPVCGSGLTGEVHLYLTD